MIELEIARAGEFLASFPEDEFYRPPLEVVRLECSRDSRGHFNLIHHGTSMKADVYPVARDPLHRWGSRTGAASPSGPARFHWRHPST